jgi:hypothetical protein
MPEATVAVERTGTYSQRVTKGLARHGIYYKHLAKVRLAGKPAPAGDVR